MRPLGARVGILSRLASEHDGERAAAGLLATRLLKSAGVSWDTVVGGRTVSRRDAAPEWRAEIDSCLKHAGLLTPWERKFLGNLQSCRSPTPRQIEKVQQIAEQLRERCAP